jgi:hypothetical protein
MMVAGESAISSIRIMEEARQSHIRIHDMASKSASYYPHHKDVQLIAQHLHDRSVRFKMYIHNRNGKFKLIQH